MLIIKRHLSGEDVKIAKPYIIYLDLKIKTTRRCSFIKQTLVHRHRILRLLIYFPEAL